MSNRKNQPQKCVETQNSRLSFVSRGQWSSDRDEYDIVVIKNLDPSTDTLEIKHGLEKLGFKVMAVRNAYNHSIGLALPVFFIKLHKNPKNVGIYDVKYVAHQVVVVEEYIHGPDPPRCTRCQDLGHTRDTCEKPPTCAWCSGPHFTIYCKIVNISPPTCARCSQRHPASYKGCIVYKRLMARKEPVREVIKSPEPNSHNMEKSSRDGKTSPQDGKTSPQYGKTTPQDGKTSPQDGKTTPQDGKTTPQDGKTSPQDGKTSPQDGKTSPQDGKTSPQDGKTSPQGGKTSPKETEVSSENRETTIQYKENNSIEMKTNPDDRVTRLLKRLEEALSSSSSSEEKPPDGSELEEMNYPLNWTPPKEQLCCVENHEQEIMQHFLSMNKDLRVKLLLSNGYSTSSYVTKTLEEAFASMF